MSKPIFILFGDITKKVAKNLILPGIGHITLLDDKTITEADLVSNFFYSPDSIGQKRSQVACELLAELNPSVKCDYDERAIEFLLQGTNGFYLFEVSYVIYHEEILMVLKFNNFHTKRLPYFSSDFRTGKTIVIDKTT